MSVAAKRRRFARWRRYRYACEKATGTRWSLTKGGMKAWMVAMYSVQGGDFRTLPPWRYYNLEDSAHGGQAALKAVPR